MESQAFIDSRRLLVDAALARLLPGTPRVPPMLDAAMRYSLLGGGKRLRPLLALAAAEGVGGDEPEQARDAAMPAACALEMLHTYSLIHDDLPAMDDDSLRRGLPTSHVVHGEGLAILAGDALQAEAFALLARLPDSSDPAVIARKLRTLHVVADAVGAAGMVGGQAIDLAADPSRQRPDGSPAMTLDASTLTDMHARKTGALIRAAVTAGAIMGGATDRTLATLDRFARSIGLAFQIIDDVLDVEGAAAELGKTAGKDAAAGKPTYVSIYGLTEARARAESCLRTALAALETAGLSRSPLGGLARWVVERRA